MGTTRELAEFMTEVTFDDLPADVVHEGRQLILESLAVTILGGRLELGRTLAAGQGFVDVRYALGDAANPQSLRNAAFVNAAWADCNDSAGGSYKSVFHPGKNLLPAVLTVGIAEDRSGEEVILAAMAATECSFRIDFAIGLEHMARGHYTDGTVGTIGTALAIGKLRGLSVEQLEAAIGNAALLAPATVGGVGMWSASGRPAALGQAAASGIYAVELAQAGIEGPADVLERDGGFAHALGGTNNLERVTRDIGDVWECLDYYLKPYVGCKLTHPAREGLQKLKREDGLTAEDVASISVSHPLYDIAVIGHHTDADANAVAASCSAPYLMATSLIYDDLGPESLLGHRIADPAVRELAARIEIVEDVALTKLYEPGIEARGDIGTPIRMEVTLRTGKTLTYIANHAKGDPVDGLEVTDDELDKKFRDYVEGVLDNDQVLTIIELVHGFERCDSMKALREELVTPNS
ncbi:MAG: hypothetical protein GEU71_02890 [Actinobacteria bacterium]|nr:hypothetical protein [Actinomycetota bacterium]